MFCEAVLQHERELLSEVSFCIFPLFILVFSQKFLDFFATLIAKYRHSTHQRNQLTRIERPTGSTASPSRIQPSIQTLTEVPMEKLQLTQMVSEKVTSARVKKKKKNLILLEC